MFFLYKIAYNCRILSFNSDIFSFIYICFYNCMYCWKMYFYKYAFLFLLNLSSENISLYSNTFLENTFLQICLHIYTRSTEYSFVGHHTVCQWILETSFVFSNYPFLLSFSFTRLKVFESFGIIFSNTKNSDSIYM